MGFKEFFSNDFETSSSHTNQGLVTRKYKGDYTKVKNAIIEVCKTLNLELQEVNDEYHEMRFSNRKQELIIDVFSKSYFEQHVDMKVLTSYFIARGRGYKLIQTFYQLLDRKLEKVL